MMKLLVIVILLACVGGATCGTVSCSYYCTRSERYTTKCGFWNWSRCTRYRAVGDTCYRTGANGEWSSWSTSGTGSCSATCGIGTLLRSFVRQCNNPAPSYCGATCPGAGTKSEYESCNAGCCPVSGGWSGWQLQSVSSCPVTCGGSTQSVTYQRGCTNPPPSCGGATCAGSSTNVVQQTCNTQSCPVHGGWSSWSVDNNGRCSVTCGEGTMSVWYRRHCNSPAPQYGGRNCTGDVTKVESASCSPQPCPVNGGWSTWTPENNSSCSVTCGAGEMSVTHTRDCTSPAPQYGGSNCTGDNTRVETVACNTQPCPVDGGWSPWHLDSNGSCSQPCGGGEQNQSYTRNCTSPAPQYGGSNCTGDNTRVETVACNTQPCPVDGSWSPWYLDSNGSCSQPCGGGEQNQSYTRNCTSPAPQYGGSNCTGDNTLVETVACNTQPCPVDGGWSPWYLDNNGSCSQPCGGGEQNQSYTRNCTSPAPQYGGSNCTGDNTRVETVACNTQPCPVDGGWSPWHLDNNGSCSQPCGGGEQNQSYTRNCTSPAPQYGGSNCTGDNTRVETVACNTQPCPVDGGWSPWYLDSNGSCSQPCGGGEQNQSYTRNCTSPAPQYGGSNCTGDNTRVESVPCNTQPCPVDGGWSPWYLDSNGSCSQRCGGGEQNQSYTRNCTSPAPQYGGSNCTGDNTRVETVACNTQPCPVDGGWSPWYLDNNGSCSHPCGGGEQNQSYTRNCTSPAPQYGGSNCTGDNTRVETVACNTQPCPVDGGWSPWYLDSNGSCSQPCGGGEQNQSNTRNCTSPAPQYGGSNCTGDNTRVETVACNTQPCPVDGGWSPWYLDSNGSCSQPCGGGEQNQSYTRNCTSPAPQYGGGDCQGDDSKTESVPCNTDPCPIDGGWSNWSKWREVGQCSALCGGGQVLQLRKRKCDNPQPAYGGSECEGAAQENKTVVCNNQGCGAQCPEGSTKFIPDTNNSRNYYQCDNGVARLMRCGVGTVWDELTNTCTQDGSQQKTECDPSRVYQPHASDCSKFIMCVQGRAYTMSCPNDLRYSDAISSCTFASDVSC